MFLNYSSIPMYPFYLYQLSIQVPSPYQVQIFSVLHQLLSDIIFHIPLIISHAQLVNKLNHFLVFFPGLHPFCFVFVQSLYINQMVKTIHLYL